MIKLLYITLGPALLFFAGFYLLALLSKSGSAPGIVNGKLARCATRPNGVCSEYPNDIDHFVDPLSYTGHDFSIEYLTQAVIHSGGSIVRTSENYLAATFTSKFFGFVDDVEIRLDTEKEHIHFRSASRVGYSDFGVNRKRVKELKKTLITNKR